MGEAIGERRSVVEHVLVVCPRAAVHRRREGAVGLPEGEDTLLEAGIVGLLFDLGIGGVSGQGRRTWAQSTRRRPSPRPHRPRPDGVPEGETPWMLPGLPGDAMVAHLRQAGGRAPQCSAPHIAPTGSRRWGPDGPGEEVIVGVQEESGQEGPGSQAGRGGQEAGGQGGHQEGHPQEAGQGVHHQEGPGQEVPPGPEGGGQEVPPAKKAAPAKKATAPAKKPAPVAKKAVAKAAPARKPGAPTKAATPARPVKPTRGALRLGYEVPGRDARPFSSKSARSISVRPRTCGPRPSRSPSTGSPATSSSTRSRARAGPSPWTASVISRCRPRRWPPSRRSTSPSRPSRASSTGRGELRTTDPQGEAPGPSVCPLVRGVQERRAPSPLSGGVT